MPSWALHTTADPVSALQSICSVHLTHCPVTGVQVHEPDQAVGVEVVLCRLGFRECFILPFWKFRTLKNDVNEFFALFPTKMAVLILGFTYSKPVSDR